MMGCRDCKTRAFEEQNGEDLLFFAVASTHSVEKIFIFYLFTPNIAEDVESVKLAQWSCAPGGTTVINTIGSKGFPEI